MNDEIKMLYDEAFDMLAGKEHDYAKQGDAHSNFKYASQVEAPFPEVYQPYACLIGIKLARLSELLSKGNPKNEGIEDSFRDLINYCGLMYARYKLEN